MKGYKKIGALLLIFTLFMMSFMFVFKVEMALDTISSDINIEIKGDPLIEIEGNAELEAANMSAGADGSEGNPYVIRDKMINGNGSYCINITNTDAYFILENCTVYNGSNGIFFDNVSNGEIRNVTAFNNNDSATQSGNGIYFIDSANNTIINCTIYNNTGTGTYSGNGIIFYTDCDIIP